MEVENFKNLTNNNMLDFYSKTRRNDAKTFQS